MEHDFNAPKALEEAHERSRHDAPRWISIAAAILAVLSALGNLLASQRSTEAAAAKSEAILAVSRASDQYNYYEAHRGRETIYQAAIDAGAPRERVTALHAVAVREREREPAILARARTFEASAEADEARSRRLTGAHDTMEIGVTLFEVAIVLVSISALTTSRMLTVVAAAASAIGAAFLAGGFLH